MLDYRYTDEAADKLSRVDTLRFDGMDVAKYAYLGLGSFVQVEYPQPGVQYNLATGSGVNPYAGLDRFGRITDLLWELNGGSSSSSSSSGIGNALVRLQYGYDLASNRTYRRDVVAESYGKDFDELYEYDGLHRLKKFHRGQLTNNNQTIVSPALQQGWQLDATGNWANFSQFDPEDNDQTLNQQRAHNRVNEITEIARNVGPDWATPSHDRNGNMTVIPQPKDMEATYTATWDAWNRLMKLVDAASGQTVQENEYDGQTWRTVRRDYAGGVLSEEREFYYSANWQVLEEGLGSSSSSPSSSSGIAEAQYVWGLRYIDDLVLRDRVADNSSSSSSSSALNERLYSMQDALFSVVALANTNGAVQERFAYQAYGESQPLTAELVERSESFYDWHNRFTGRRLDVATALMYYRARYYHVSLGRFVGRDPIEYESGWNLYEYVGGSPILYSDPEGLIRLHPYVRRLLCGTFAHQEIANSVRAANPQYQVFANQWISTIVRETTGKSIAPLNKKPDIVLYRPPAEPCGVASVYEIKPDTWPQEQASEQLGFYLGLLINNGVTAYPGDGTHGGVNGSGQVSRSITGFCGKIRWWYEGAGIIRYEWMKEDESEKNRMEEPRQLPDWWVQSMQVPRDHGIHSEPFWELGVPFYAFGRRFLSPIPSEFAPPQPLPSQSQPAPTPSRPMQEPVRPLPRRPYQQPILQ